MNRRSAGLAASNPSLIGAITVLVTLVAVTLAYNANNGLPFVPTYELQARVPDAQELVPGNEVRVGGRRAGTVTAIRAFRRVGSRYAAELELELDQRLAPVRSDARVMVRPRSPLGLKYVELTLGTRGRPLPEGAVLPLARASDTVELDEVLDALDAPLRADLVGAVGELAEGVAGRGRDVNAALGALPELLDRMASVAGTLAHRDTDLAGFLAGAQATAGALAPVRRNLGAAFGHAATTLEALDASGDDLEATLTTAPRALRDSARSLDRIEPVVADATALARDLRPGAQVLPATADRLARLADRAAPTLGRADGLVERLDATVVALRALVRDPATGPAVRRLSSLVASLEPTLRFLAPLQTRCNYLGVWTRNAASVVSEGDENGTWFRFAPISQADEVFQSARPGASLHNTPYPQTGQEGECEAGNEPYAPGRFIGNPPTREPGSTDDTAPPPGVGR